MVGRGRYCAEDALERIEVEYEPLAAVSIRSRRWTKHDGRLAQRMTTGRSSPVDGFRLAYERHGAGAPAILLHGWPGDRHDYRDVIELLGPRVDTVVPDLRGFGQSDKHAADPLRAYDAAAQARSIIGLMEELELDRPVLGGYDVGSRVAQSLARTRPDLVRGLVLSPPLPGVGDRILSAAAQREFWYQPFHQSSLVEQLIDGRPDAVRGYLAHFWQRWSGPGYTPDPAELDRLAGLYGAPGALVASINYYRAGAGTVQQSLSEQVPAESDRIQPPVVVIWPGADALFPKEWSDQLHRFFALVELRVAETAGHFTPLEAPELFARAVTDLLEDGQT